MVITYRFNPFDIPRSSQENRSQTVEHDANDECWYQQPVIYYRDNCYDPSKFKEKLKNF